MAEEVKAVQVERSWKNMSSDEFLSWIQSTPISELSDLFLTAPQGMVVRAYKELSADNLLRVFANVSEDALKNLLKFSRGQYLVELLSRASNELVERVIDSAPSHRSRVELAKSLPVERRRRWLDYVKEQQDAIEEVKISTSHAKGALFEERNRLLQDLDSAIRAREDTLRNYDEESRIKRSQYERDIDEAKQRLSDLYSEIESRGELIKRRETELSVRLAEFEEANRRQVQQRIEAKVPEFVADAVKALELREALYRRKAMQWSTHGTLVLLAAISIAIFVSLYGYSYGGKIESLSWQAMMFVSFKGLVVVGILGLWAKHAFSVSNAYMHEAIKRSDRAHAINFGKLYLEVYGNSVERKELIDIFENWNIASESAFSKMKADGFEPKVLDQLVEITKGLNLAGREEKSAAKL
ncbi:hypothetical protein VW792_005248 [Pseudomonas aeruginosa]|nr:hypothetical protein [Pseudomonas aeruginosa]